MDFLTSLPFWIALGQIIMIDILLGGDNAVVIALACRKLPPAQRTQGIIWGTAGAIILRVILIFFAMTLLALPWLKFVGAILLVWIGVKLLAPDEDGHGELATSDKLLAAIKTIIVADLVMSVDNVIASAGSVDLHPDHRLGQPAGHQADGALPDDHHRRRHAAGLDRRWHAGIRPGDGQPGQMAVDAQAATKRHGQVRCFHCRRSDRAGDRQVRGVASGQGRTGALRSDPSQLTR